MLSDEYADGADGGDDFSYEFGYESAPARVSVAAGEAQRKLLSADDQDERARRLAEWEEQLLAYNAQLGEDSWRSWKKGAVVSVMAELQQKMLPQQLSLEAHSSAEHTEVIQRAHEKEAALLRRIDELENGPGCARELKEQIEQMQVRLGQQQQREKHRHVVAEMLQNAVSDGGGIASGKRAVMAARAAKLFGQRSAAEKADADGEAAGAADFLPELRARASEAQRQAIELREQLGEQEKSHQKAIEAVQAELKRVREESASAQEALRSVHVEAGIHEAQEMSQLRMELVTLNDEVGHSLRPGSLAASLSRTPSSSLGASLAASLAASSAASLAAAAALWCLAAPSAQHSLARVASQVKFLRSREEALRSEQNRIMNAQELNKKFNANISRAEVEGLRSQVASLGEEAHRVQAANQVLQAQLKEQRDHEAEIGALSADVKAFQADTNTKP